jgi:hypothetical protein
LYIGLAGDTTGVVWFVTVASIVVVRRKSICGSPMAWTLKTRK